MPETLLLFIAVVFAALLQAGTGFGFSLLATPFFLFRYPPSTAIQVNMILSLLLSMAMAPAVAKHLDWPMLRRLVIAAALALPLGIPLATLDGASLRLTLGSVLLALTILLLIGPRFARSARGDYLTGGLSALMTVGMGMPGPPLLVYLSGTGSEKMLVRSTALSFFIFAYICGLALHFVYNGTDRETWHAVALMSPAVAIGTLAGRWLHHRLSPELYRALLYAVLAGTGIATLAQAR